MIRGDYYSKFMDGWRVAEIQAGEMVREINRLRVREAVLLDLLRSLGHLVPRDIEMGKPGYALSKRYWAKVDADSEGK